jgi:UPF0042 nucleotide-binding protein
VTLPTQKPVNALVPAGLTLISFGYLHDAAPTADLVLDVRRYLRDPAPDRKILDLNGFHPHVQAVVMKTPGAKETLTHLTRFALDLPAAYPGIIAIGCAGGRHRSVVLVEHLATRLVNAGCPVTVIHRHMHLPRVIHTGGAK